MLCCVQLPDVTVAAAAAGPDVGYTMSEAQKGTAQGSGDGHMTSAVGRKRVGRPRKADAEVGVALEK